MDDFEARIVSTLREHEMLETEEGAVVGASGGPDSTALLLALHSLGHPVIVAHLHHGLRGDEADEDEAFLHRLSARLGLTCLVERRDVGGIARAARRSVEEVGRAERYSFLERVARVVGLRAVAVAHTRDDQAETILARAGRGCGVRGLRGILPVRPILHGSQVLLIRPLLDVGRADVEAYLRARGQEWREDSTNLDARFQRGRLRAALREAPPRTAEVLARLATQARETTRRLHEEALRFVEAEVRLEGRGVLALDRARLAALAPTVRHEVYREVARRLGVRAPGLSANRSIEEALAGKGGGKDLPGGSRVERVRDAVEWRRTGVPVARPPAGYWTLGVPGVLAASALGIELAARIEPGGLAELRQRLSSRSQNSELRTQNCASEWLDADRVCSPLVLRLRRAGDRFHPLGAPGPQKLKKFLIDHKVPCEKRGTLPILADREGILWIVGVRIRHDARVTQATQRLLHLSARQLG